MLLIVDKLSDLNVAQLKQVYCQSIFKSSESYRGLSENLRILEAEQDFYEGIRQFFSQKDAFYALWSSEGVYVSALRLEPYADGLILTGLETAPTARGLGYATALVKEALGHICSIGYKRVYSHVARDNFISLAVHKTCGFSEYANFAVYLDGSTVSNAVTMLYEC